MIQADGSVSVKCTQKKQTKKQQQKLFISKFCIKEDLCQEEKTSTLFCLHLSTLSSCSDFMQKEVTLLLLKYF